MNKKSKKNSSNKKIISAILLAIIFCAGVYLRVGGALSGSFAFTYDVGRDLIQVQDIVVNHKVPLIGQTSGLGGLFYGPWWYYILTPPFIVSGGNPQGIALFMAIMGVFTVFVGYILGVKIAGYRLGILLAAFLAISDVVVGLSTQIWNPNTAPLLILLFFLCFFFQPKKRYKNILLSVLCGFILGLILDSEIVFGVLFIGGLCLASLILFRNSIISKRSIYMVLGIVLSISPRIFFEIRHNFVMSKSLLNVSNEQSIFNAKDFFTVLPDRSMVFIRLLAETFGVNVLIALILCVCVGVIWILTHRKTALIERQIFYTCVIILGVFLIGSSFFARAIWGHYLVGVPILYIIIVSVALALCMKKNKYLGIVIFVVLVFFSSKPAQVLSNFQNPKWEGDAAVYRNQVAVIDYIYKDARGKGFNYTAYTPSVHDYPYRYLFSWYGQKKYGYVPSTDTSKRLYMILEPDPGYEGRLTDWLKVREGDGTVIDENTIKGGIKVQKRVR